MKVTRRTFLQLTSLGGSSVGLGACSDLVPATVVRRQRGPEQTVVTACGGCQAGCGIAVRVVGGDAVQIEGVPDHPVNGMGVCPRGIAEIQNLYHPERLQAPRTKSGEALKWDAAIDRVATELKSGGAVIGVGVLAPAELALIEHLARAVGATIVNARLPHCEHPSDAFAEMLGSHAYGYDLAHADFVLSLGADWLQTHPSPVEAQRAFGALRRQKEKRGVLVTASARLSITASKSDEWIPVRSDHLPAFALGLMHEMLKDDGELLGASRLERARELTGYAQLAALAAKDRFAPDNLGRTLGIRAETIAEVARDLAASPHAVVVSDATSEATQRAGVALNLLLGAVDRAGGVRAASPLPLPSPLAPTPASHPRSFPTETNKPAVLLIGANPRYVGPTSGWREGLARARFVASISSFLDESAAQADIVLPPSAALESPQLTWGSTLSGEGFASAGPPAVARRYDTLGSVDVLLRLCDAVGARLPWSDGKALQAAAAEALGAESALEDGGSVSPVERDAVETTAAAATESAAGSKSTDDSKSAAGTAAGPSRRLLAFDADLPDEPGKLVLDTYVPLAFHGGRGAHLPYLHGLTHGIEREVWRTVVEMHPRAAAERGLADGRWVWIESEHGRIRAIMRLRQGIRPDVIAIGVGLGGSALVDTFGSSHGGNPLELVSPTGPTLVDVRIAS